MKFGLTKKQMDIILHVFLDYPFVDEVILFGSRSTGEHKRTSDIDIALKGNMDRNQLSKVKRALQDATLIPLFFDIIDYSKISNKLLLEEIDKKGISIFRKGSVNSSLSKSD